MLKISNLKINPIYFEHVTNYNTRIQKFKIEKIIVPKNFLNLMIILVSQDDKTDFEITSSTTLNPIRDMTLMKI